MTQELEDKYRAEVLQKHGISEDTWAEIREQARRESWPLPDAPPVCR